MKLSLGTIQYYWPKEAVYRFYEMAAALPVDIVYLGETVCARRHELRHEDWLAIAAILQSAGKEVVFSTQVLLESDAHLNTMRRITDNGTFFVEANDMGAVRRLAGKADFVAGMHLNVYNPSALGMMADMGAKRWVMPLEMDRDDLSRMMGEKPDGVEVEVFACGRMPLAFSARCFTARHYNLPKDDCDFRCLGHPDGMLLKTREGEDFLVFNGIQTQSDRVYSLLSETEALRAAGVDVLRISPQYGHMAEIIRLHADAVSGSLSLPEAVKALKLLLPSGLCNGYWYGQPGMAYVGEGVK